MKRLDKHGISKFATRYGTVVFFALICAAFAILRPLSFFKISNVVTVLR